MNRDEFAQAVFDRLPKECPGSKREILGALFGSAAKVIEDLPPAEVEETESQVCHSHSATGSR